MLPDIYSTNRICAVCGDFACGYNYAIMSCVSCKTFFQRNGLSKKEFICKFNGNCDITYSTRRWCQKCRLNKCLAVGMKKEYLMSDEERQLRRVKLREKWRAQTAKRKCDRIVDIKSDNGSNDLLIWDKNKEKDILDEILENYRFSEEVILNSDKSDDNYGLKNSSENINTNELEIEYSLLPIIRPITDYMNTFNEYEGNKLTELLNAMTLLEYNYCQTFNKIYEPTDYFNAFALWAPQTEVYIRNVVNMSKKLSLFTEICEQDKLCQLKYGALEINGLRSILDFNYERKVYRLYQDNNYMVEIPMDLGKVLHPKVYELNQIFLATFMYGWDSDQIILNLLSVIILFNPNRPKLMNRQIVRFHQYVYMYLLKRYLLLKYRSESESNAKFAKLIESLQIVNTISDLFYQYVSAHKHIYKPIMGPLAQEIYEID